MAYKNPKDPRIRQSARKYHATMKGRALQLVKSAQRSAAKKNVKFDLTRPWVLAQMKKGCAITGLPFDLTPNSIQHNNPYAPSLDRIRAGKNYTKRNVRVVLWAINAASWSWGWPEFQDILKKSGWTHATDRRRRP
jgi:hypothetical protein